MKAAVSKYWSPFFSGKMLGEVTRQDVENLIAGLETIKTPDNRIPKSAKRKNIIIQAGTVPLSTT
jgi:hypothetical protein